MPTKYLTQRELGELVKRTQASSQREQNNRRFSIKKVIFNDPATIVIWEDGSKTVVKCQDGDIFDKEKGLAMAISKRALGDKGKYCNTFKKWIPEIEESKVETAKTEIEVFFDDTNTNEAIQKLHDAYDAFITR